jgi:hypothetical protein
MVLIAKVATMFEGSDTILLSFLSLLLRDDCISDKPWAVKLIT